MEHGAQGLRDMGDPKAVNDPVVAEQLRVIIDNVERLGQIAADLEKAIQRLDIMPEEKITRPIQIVGGRGAKVTRRPNGEFVVEAR